MTYLTYCYFPSDKIVEEDLLDFNPGNLDKTSRLLIMVTRKNSSILAAVFLWGSAL